MAAALASPSAARPSTNWCGKASSSVAATVTPLIGEEGEQVHRWRRSSVYCGASAVVGCSTLVPVAQLGAAAEAVLHGMDGTAEEAFREEHSRAAEEAGREGTCREEVRADRRAGDRADENRRG
eukprot:CAMPEP_0177785260 /NCGR_PEP_ID=MMETSP0491_2-20121128/20200_1 /TAXON_ID=63592 /ORGANISM="Tetraselmis chuii, Strain PLY429" /LENGTH=123 /DNA_ID=CAMNT_0019306203 /DNA_START=404 /DNA_END=776 /DNA_ORIENTATION=+